MLNLMQQSFEIIERPESNQDEINILKHLELIGRTCYKSEDKITDSSAIKFIEMLYDRKHWAMLEHYVFVFEVSEDVYELFNQDYLMQIVGFDANIVEKLRYIHRSYVSSEDADDDTGMYLISGSATAFNYLWGIPKFVEHYNNLGLIKLFTFFKYMEAKWPHLFKDPIGLDTLYDGIANIDVRTLSNQEIESLPFQHRLIHQTMSVRFITNRGVSHEIVRHRPASYGQESTRYCNYGNKGINLIIPSWMPELDYQTLLNTDPMCLMNNFRNLLGEKAQLWFSSAIRMSDDYNRLLKSGCKPQEARGVLENDLKTEIVMTANMYEWNHFFKMRADKAAHPDMQSIAYPLLSACHQKYSEIFDDNMKRVAREDRDE